MNRAFFSVLALTFLLSGSANSAENQGLRCGDFPQLFSLYLRFHYVNKSMNDELRRHTVDQFIKQMDPSKALLYQSDVEKFKNEIFTVFKTSENGQCEQIAAAQKVLLSRAEENAKLVKEILGDKYILNEKAELITDPDKRSNPKDAAERKALLESMVHFQISNHLLSKTKMKDAKKNVIHSYALTVKRIRERTLDKGYADFAESFARALDPHSGYLAADNAEEFNISMQLSLEGIGASLSSQDGFTVIEEVIPGGPADLLKVSQPDKKLMAKDKIVAVKQDGKDANSVIDMDLSNVVKQIRGKKGSKVTLTILRETDANKRFDVTITRNTVDIKEAAAKLTYENKKVGDKNYKIGVIDFPSFYGKEGARSSYTDMKKLVTEATRNKVDGLILDLSKNGGGLLDEAVKIAGLFIRQGPIVATKGFDQKISVLSDRDESIAYTGPLMILTSRLSASASEILAGALKNYNRALIVGSDHTFGKGTVQMMTALPPGLGAMKVSTGMFFIPDGESTQHKGVMSHMELPSVFNQDEIGEKTMDYSLPAQKISTFIGTEGNEKNPLKQWKPIDNSILPRLKQLSNERIAKDERFKELLETLAESKKNKGVVKLAEMRKKANEEDAKNKGKKEKSRKAKIQEIQEPFIGESVNIMIDWINGARENPVSTAASK